MIFINFKVKLWGKIKLKKKKLSLILVSALAVIILLAGCGKEKATSTEEQNTGNSKSEKKIIVGTSPDYYPWCYTEAGKLQGFEIDVWNEIGKKQDMILNLNNQNLVDYLECWMQVK